MKLVLCLTMVWLWVGLLRGQPGPSATFYAEGTREYYGKLVGQLTTNYHKVSGKVFAVDEDTLFIKDFNYDGYGPDAYFWIGKSGDPSLSGILVPHPDEYKDGEPPVLRGFDREDVILHLPPGYKVKEIAWLSVWCRRFTVNFGDVKVPKNLKVPQRKVLPEFKRLAHGVRSGNITILDSRTFYIPNLYYDGAGPDAFFCVGTGSEPHTGGRKIPNEKESLDVLSGYKGENIWIQLPEELTVFDIDWLSMWCIRYKHNFGYVTIPKQGLDVPPSLDKFKRGVKPKAPRLKDSYSNCKDLLSKDVQLEWELDVKLWDWDWDYVKFKLSGRISEKQWVALGFSPMKGRTLKLVCEVGRPVELVWKVPMDAPDLLYYQCYTHKNLGWKIHVVNSGERVIRDTLNSSSPLGGADLTLFSLTIISSFLVINPAI